MKESSGKKENAKLNFNCKINMKNSNSDCTHNKHTMLRNTVTLIKLH